MGHGYFTVFGYGFLVSRKSVETRAALENQSFCKYIEEEDDYIRSTFAARIHREEQYDKYEYMFLCFADTQIYMDARGACGDYRGLSLDELQLKVGSQVDRTQRLQEYLKERGLTFLAPGFYLYSYEGG